MKFKRFSDFLILQSAAGFYIGKVEFVSDDESQPYSRNSQYFETREEAEYALEHIDDFLIELDNF